MASLEKLWITFQVMDIMSAYNCLLWRPWTHSVGVLPSTMHKRLKFLVDENLIIVYGEELLLLSKSSTTRYIEVVGTTYMETSRKKP
ncbi:hypothetical protein CR513_32725, partial [Mucuna pruriens]